KRFRVFRAPLQVLISHMLRGTPSEFLFYTRNGESYEREPFFRPLGKNEADPTLAFDALCITRKRFGT
ncbi:hypothetical protein P4S64_19550, partial [Vibrio sp. M60_M31a]